MMKAKLTVDGIETSYPEGTADLESLLLFVMSHELLETRLIVQIKVDGDIYSEKDEHQARGVDLKSAQKVEVATQAKEDFARGFLEEASNYMALIEKGIRISVQLLKDPGQSENGHDMLARSLEALRTFKSHLENSKDTLEIDHRGAGFRDFREKFESVTDKIMESQKGMDSSVIADLLEHELLPVLGKWREDITQKM
jgi:hypothetical protein